jgi:poly(3-hydroxybutyrate) depolymerase
MIHFTRRLGIALAGLALTAVAVAGTATTAAAITTPLPTPPRVNPCLHVEGTPDPCAPVSPGHPEPVDPGCLRVDVEPLRCPYQP